jgi:protein PET100
MYIMFPIGIMYYFGVNLDEKFSTPDFWPKKSQTHTIPFEKDDIQHELAALKEKRLAARDRRLKMNALMGEQTGGTMPPTTTTNQSVAAPVKADEGTNHSWFSWSK